MRRRRRHGRRLRFAAFFFALALLFASLIASSAVLHPETDSPRAVDAIVVVAGALDDRYVYARHLAEAGVSDHLIVSRPPSATGSYGTALASYCEASPVVARDGRRIAVECFTPTEDTTEGEAVSANRIALRRGYESLLVVTYWGHVSRVRLYFEQCFEGAVYVTDTPRPSQISRRYALLHETGGYVKALLRPAC